MHFKPQFHYFALNKPYGYLSQFTAEGNWQGLQSLPIELPSSVYSVGRLDADSEGLLILTNDPSWNAAYLKPENHVHKTYYVQVEGDIQPEALHTLLSGVSISAKSQKWFVKALEAEKVHPPDWLWERTPPIRFRAQIPTSWVKLTIDEGKNRQVRKMTAAVGYPTLRLIRYQFGPFTLQNLAPACIRALKAE